LYSAGPNNRFSLADHQTQLLRKGKEKFLSLFCFLINLKFSLTTFLPYPIITAPWRRGCTRPGLTTVFHWPIAKPSLKKRDKEKFATFFGSLIQPSSRYQLFRYIYHSNRILWFFRPGLKTVLLSLADHQTQLNKR